MNIPWSKPYLDNVDAQYVNDALDSTWISEGEFNEKLETELCETLEIDNCLLTSNGTTALHLAFLGLGLIAGDKIAIPGFGYLAAANIAHLMGLEVYFYDVDGETYNCDLQELDRLVQNKIKAFVVVQNYGNISNMDVIESWGEFHGILIIEDAAESFGSKYKNKWSGSFGDISTLSFHATKTITCGEGGAVTTKNPKLAKRMKLIRSHGVDKKRYFHLLYGHNFRMTNMQAALGYSQLKKKNKIFELKKEIVKLYELNLAGSTELIFQKFSAEVEPVIWAVAVRLVGRTREQRDNLINRLSQDGIETRSGFYTPYNLQIYKTGVFLPNSETLSSEIILLPSFTGLSNQQIDHVCERLTSNI